MRPLRALFKASLALIGFILFVGGLYLLLHNNFHVVIPNQVYRSAQMNPKTLNATIKRERLKSVINLRGSNPKDAWYRQEKQVIQRDDLAFYNIRLS